MRLSPSARQHLQKTRICTKWSNGRCNKESCPYAHGSAELRQAPDFTKTTLCPHWSETGSCPRGSRCRYAHGEEELRASEVCFRTKPCWQWFWDGVCDKGDRCTFAHHGPSGRRLREGQANRSRRHPREGKDGEMGAASNWIASATDVRKDCRGLAESSSSTPTSAGSVDLTLRRLSSSSTTQEALADIASLLPASTQDVVHANKDTLAGRGPPGLEEKPSPLLAALATVLSVYGRAGESYAACPQQPRYVMTTRSGWVMKSHVAVL
mmetsp:Transcript_680/g.1415  ORF Transcript_680/g.1415 Transcript_680/m.1415 type:complete len:267 (-) Transcript_680:1503-2303(-)